MRMRQFVICSLSLLVFLTSSCEGNEADDNEIEGKREHICREKEKCLALIDIADDLVSKTKVLCSKSDGSPDCVKREKSSTYMDFTKRLLKEVKENFPSCKTFECGDRPRDCSEVLANGHKKNGIYSIYPTSRFVPERTLTVYCDMETDGGGWTVIQRRGNFIPQQDFYLYWKDFKNGFGDVKRDFWLGNDNIYALSNQGPVEIRIELEDARGNRRYAVYKHFRLEDEEHKYKLWISNYTGDAGDGMSAHSGKRFSTKDEGKASAVTALKGAWWINVDWAHSHLNGLYLPGQDDPKSIHWYEWLQNEGLAFTEMKIRLR
ncbi:techylectin-5A-like [Argiope bruennichi]|uniref:techylectin-5A-like n=1 Tax=Argiope bruennichi TaxID=94029 RepID=UPI0024949317|nr:techylectin-5A-like [Argiope bruennichi]